MYHIALFVIFTILLAVILKGMANMSVDTSTKFGRCLHDCSSVYGSGDLSIKCQQMCNNPLHALDGIK